MRAYNVYGPGAYSDETTIKAAQEPGQVTLSSLSSVISSTDVVITWAAPYDNEQPITAYRILIKQADGSSSQELVHCDGANSTVIAALSCTIPIQTLRASPFSLVQSSQVLFTVAAYNSYGWSLASQENSVIALIQTEPHAPTGLTYQATISSMTNIAITWIAL